MQRRRAAIAWLAGVYALDVDETLDEGRRGVYIDPFTPEFSGTTDDHLRSDYDARNIAVFGQLDGSCSARAGAGRSDCAASSATRTTSDSGAQNGVPRATDAIERRHDVGRAGDACTSIRDERCALFATLSRGYKAGGFNLGQAATHSPRFDAEYLWSLDVGAKGEWLDRRLYADVTAFYMKREDMQISTGVQLDPIGDPSSYFFFTDNASGGRNLGVESSVRWRADATAEFGGTLGLLRTRYYGYRPAGEDLSARDQAHAPEYQVSLNATWRHPLGWMARVDVAAVDDYYFDVPPNDIAQPRLLADAHQGRLRGGSLERVRLGPQRVRRGLRRARVLLRQRAAAVREQALRAARRAAAVRSHRPMGVSLMRTAIEISLYPLDADYIPPIKAFIDRLNTYPGAAGDDQRDEHADRRRARAPVRDPRQGNRDHLRRARPQGVRDEGARRERLMEKLLAQLLATSPWEAVGALLGLAYLLLAVRRNLLCWLCAFVSTSIYLVLFARAALYMQSLLQVFYLVMAVYGFIDWRRGRTAAGEVVIRSWTPMQHAIVAVLSSLRASSTAGCWRTTLMPPRRTSIPS